MSDRFEDGKCCYAHFPTTYRMFKISWVLLAYGVPGFTHPCQNCSEFHKLLIPFHWLQLTSYVSSTAFQTLQAPPHSKVRAAIYDESQGISCYQSPPWVLTLLIVSARVIGTCKRERKDECFSEAVEFLRCWVGTLVFKRSIHSFPYGPPSYSPLLTAHTNSDGFLCAISIILQVYDSSSAYSHH
jgi:hypothetical protein